MQSEYQTSMANAIVDNANALLNEEALSEESLEMMRERIAGIQHVERGAGRGRQALCQATDVLLECIDVAKALHSGFAFDYSYFNDGLDELASTLNTLRSIGNLNIVELGNTQRPLIALVIEERCRNAFAP